MSLSQQWRDTRPIAKGVHLDSAACSRQSFAAIDAAAAHARREAEVGGYVAAEEAEDILTAGRAAVAALTGMTADDNVFFTTGACHALDLLLSAWPGQRRTIACVPGEFGPNMAIMAANGFDVTLLPVDSMGCVAVDDLAVRLIADAPSMVHLTVVPSHRGIAQPLQQIAEACDEVGVPLVVDAAQGLGHVDCAVSADAIYTSSRKWLAGPRGVGALAIRADRTANLQPRLPLGVGEANIAARVGFSVAVTEYLEYGARLMRAGLADAGRLTRAVLGDLEGWRVVEPLDAPTAITTLAPTEGADVERARTELITRHAIVTTVAGPDRAPFELSAPVLRVSPHVDVTEEDLTTFARALRSVCEQ